MGQKYSQFSQIERVTIMLMRRDGSGIREIARQLGRAPSSVSREVRRQPDVRSLPYEATRAQAQAFARSRRCRNPRKLRIDSALFQWVVQQLRMGWSPSQIAGRLARMHPDDPAQRVSHETIYLALYALPRGELRRELLACLRQAHQVRRPRGRGTDRRDRIAEALRIAARPEEVAERKIPGHWEGDFIKGAFNRSAVGTLVERTSRLVMLAKMDHLDALAAQEGFERQFLGIPAELRKSLTYDRGSEMARHAEFTRHTGVKVYFADPYSPWQRGSNENANGLIREYLPKGTDLSVHGQADLDQIAYLLNNRPRKVLAFRTPWEVYSELQDRLLADAASVALGR